MNKKYGAGAGMDGQLATGRLQDEHSPQLLRSLSAFGPSAVNIDNGSVCTCGDGLFGQLGHGDYESKCSPLEVVYLSSKHVEQVAGGMRHTLALLKGDVEHKVNGFE